MVKVVVNPGRKAWDRENRREASAGEVLEVRDVEAKILKYRGVASDSPPEPPLVGPGGPNPPAPPPTPQPKPSQPATPPRLSSRVVTPEPSPAAEEEEEASKRSYRRRDLQAET
jgi:hypothetical protein